MDRRDFINFSCFNAAAILSNEKFSKTAISEDQVGLSAINFEKPSLSNHDLDKLDGNSRGGDFDQAGLIRYRKGESISVKDFGALGDGVSDDSEAFNTAIIAASCGKELFVPPGVYLCPSLDVSVQGIKIYLCGAGMHLSKVIGSKNTFIQLKDGGVCSVKNLWFDNWRVVIKINNNKNTDEYEFIEVSDCKFTKIDVSPITDIATPANGGIRRLEFVGNLVNNVGFVNNQKSAAIRIESKKLISAVISNNYIYGVGGGFSGEKSGIALVSTNNNSNSAYVISNNYIANVTNSDIAHVSGINVHGPNLRVFGNFICDVQSTARGCNDQYGIYTKSSYSVIDGNVLLNAGGRAAVIMTKGYPNDMYGLELNAYDNDNIICNNTLRVDSTSHDLKTIGIQTYNSGMNIHNNVIEGVAEGIAITESLWAPVEKINIHHNKIKNISGGIKTAIGIQFIGTDLCSISDNDIDGIGSGKEISAVGIYAEYKSGVSHSVKIKGNRITSVKGRKENASRGISIGFSEKSIFDTLLIDDNVVREVGRGLNISCTGKINNVVVRNNNFKNCEVSYISVNKENSKNIAFDGNMFDGTDYLILNNGEIFPSVLGVKLLKTANVSPTKIVGFSFPSSNQFLTIEIDDKYTSIKDGPELQLSGRKDWEPKNGGVMVLKYCGNEFKEISRVDF